jgi:hypothetical protein
MSVLVPALTPANQLTTTGEVCAHPGCQTCRLLGGCDGVGTHTLNVAAGGTSTSVLNASEEPLMALPRHPHLTKLLRLRLHHCHRRYHSSQIMLFGP